jgi:ABC-type sulfate transport system permease subunit
MTKKLLTAMIIIPVVMILTVAVCYPITDGSFHHRLLGAVYDLTGGSVGGHTLHTLGR